MRIFATFLAFSLLLASCDITDDRVRGNGTIKTELRNSGTFNAVDVSENIDLYVKQDSTRSVKIVTDDNLMKHIEVLAEGETLVIRPQDGYNLRGTNGIKVYVSSPAINQIKASGACTVKSENMLTGGSMDIRLSGASDLDLEVDMPTIEAKLSGACFIRLKGKTRDLSIEGSGAVKAKTMELLAENVTVKISGAGDADVFASVKLDVRVSGAGDVNYKGNATVTKNISGAGSVSKVD
jgi:hypothetical protein